MRRLHVAHTYGVIMLRVQDELFCEHSYSTRGGSFVSRLPNRRHAKTRGSLGSQPTDRQLDPLHHAIYASYNFPIFVSAASIPVPLVLASLLWPKTLTIFLEPSIFASPNIRP